MIVRIVKMTFRPEEIDNFLKLFEERKEKIRNVEGCMHLELWSNTAMPHIMFTYSHWRDVQALDRYRFSDFFKDTWTRTRALFLEKAEAWSLEQLHILD